MTNSNECKTTIYAIIPKAKPRIGRGDTFKPRDIVLKYWAYKEHAQLLGLKVPVSGAHVLFHMPMPKSWTISKKMQFNGKPHQNTPDIDNLTKGLLDAVFDEDKFVWDIRTTKLWAYEGAIEVIEGHDA